MLISRRGYSWNYVLSPNWRAGGSISGRVYNRDFTVYDIHSFVFFIH